ncbi:Maf family protein [Acetobacter conturbans]|uniref:Nucleoside triphosphate pyrophosphatase n=1 Tax=Acetobacter conturbans TaxID=1737472 RepID=A0ABX0K1P1_9PROT|nr:nucleoside triphosphate pyrophosphatase [Acetobacter conturbans]NHN89082.1 Maf-like protein [Acetobacter conturbans]
MIDSSTAADEVLAPSFLSAKSRLVLASGSSARQALLRESRVDFTVRTADIDENEYKQAGREKGQDASQVALCLAEAKAGTVAATVGDPDAWVIGADQMLTCQGAGGSEWFDKPSSRQGARAQLLRLRGKTHHLHSAVVLWWQGRVMWTHLAQPALTMRSFSEQFLDAYLESEGEACLGCVGSYRLEGTGIQLFQRIEGDHSAILGLPLLPLLNALRDFGVLAK